MSLDTIGKGVGIERSEYRVLTRVFPSTEKGEADAAKFMRKELEKNYPTLDEFEREDLFQGFKEIFSNALYYGNLELKGQVGSYRDKGEVIPWNTKGIIVTLKFSPGRFTVTVQDEGEGFDLEKVRAGIESVMGEGVLAPHHRGMLFIRKWQYGSPVRIEFIRDPNEPVPDAKKKILGTRATLTRDFSVPLPIMEDVEDYIEEVQG